jgi:hypothetical protein
MDVMFHQTWMAVLEFQDIDMIAMFRIISVNMKIEFTTLETSCSILIHLPSNICLDIKEFMPALKQYYFTHSTLYQRLP